MIYMMLWEICRYNKECPAELAEGIPGTGILYNNDFRDDTLTGADMSNHTDVMFVQPKNLEQQTQDETLSLTSSKEIRATQVLALQNYEARLSFH